MSDRQFTGYRSLDDARAKLRAAKDAGGDWIALHGLNQFPAGDFHAIVAEAHRLGLKIMVSGDLAEFLEVAVEAGVDSIEYMDRTTSKEYPLQVVSGIARKGIFVVPPVGYLYRFMAYRENPALLENPLLTLFMAPSVAAYVMEKEQFVKYMAGREKHITEAFPNRRGKFQQLRKAGVRMPVGTDCGSAANFHIDAIWWELETRRQLGVPVNEILTAATAHGAALLSAPDAGHLRIGARGDLLLYK